MMKRILVVILVTLMFASPGFTAVATNTTPDDTYSAEYRDPIETSVVLRNLQDAVPAIAVIAAPDSTATNITFTYTLSGGTNWVASTTNLVQVSKYRPWTWTVSTWPVANSNGIAYALLVITNSPTYTFNDLVITGGDSDVAIYITNYTHDVSISNIWLNTTPGTASGWTLIGSE